MTKSELKKLLREEVRKVLMNEVDDKVSMFDLLQSVSRGETSYVKGVKVDKKQADTLIKIYDLLDVSGQRKFDAMPADKLVRVFNDLIFEGNKLRKRTIKQSINEDLLDIIPYFKKKREEAEKKEADTLKRRQLMAYNNVKDIYDITVKELDKPKYSKSKEARLKKCDDLVWTFITGSPKNEKLNWSDLKTSYDWDELNDFDLMDQIEMAFSKIAKTPLN